MIFNVAAIAIIVVVIEVKCEIKRLVIEQKVRNYCLSRTKSTSRLQRAVKRVHHGKPRRSHR